MAGLRRLNRRWQAEGSLTQTEDNSGIVSSCRSFDRLIENYVGKCIPVSSLFCFLDRRSGPRTGALFKEAPVEETYMPGIHTHSSEAFFWLDNGQLVCEKSIFSIPNLCATASSAENDKAARRTHTAWTVPWRRSNRILRRSGSLAEGIGRIGCFSPTSRAETT